MNHMKKNKEGMITDENIRKCNETNVPETVQSKAGKLFEW
jgi:hypothetical protein